MRLSAFAAGVIVPRMNADTDSSDSPDASSESCSDETRHSQPGAVEKAIRARALYAIEQEQSRPSESPRRRALVILLTFVALCVVVYGLNWVVTGMHRIMDIWYPGSISGRYEQPQPPPGTTGSAQPFVITVTPADGEEASSASASP